jgi:hypothetical protein
MAKLITSIATIATIVGIVAALALVFSPEAHQARQINNHYTEQYQRLQLEEQQNWQRQYEPLLQAATATALVSVTAIAVLLLAGVGFALVTALVHAAQSLRPGHRYAMRQLTAQTQVLVSDAQHRHALPIQTLTYSPHFSNRVDQAAALPGDTAHDAQPASVPTFADLLAQGAIGLDAQNRKQPLILGYSEGSPVDGAWLDVYSSALAGMPHSGKTTSQRFLACQLALLKSRFIVCDPHMQAGDDSLAATLAPLQGQYLCEPADEPGAILESIRYADSIGHARITGKDSSRDPVVLWIDELNGLLADATVGPELVRLLKETARQYRKIGVYISAVAHTWSASSTGGNSDLRANFASRMCHRMERSQARLLLPTELAEKVERLQPGQAVLHSMRHSAVLTVPQTTAHDVRTVAGLLTGDQPTVEVPPKTSAPAGPGEVLLYSDCSANEVPTERTSNAAASQPLPADVARVLALFAEGHSTGEIAQQVYGAPKSGGKSTEARRLVESVIRTHYQPHTRAVGE